MMTSLVPISWTYPKYQTKEKRVRFSYNYWYLLLYSPFSIFYGKLCLKVIRNHFSIPSDYHKISKMCDLCLESSDCSEIWQTSRQSCRWYIFVKFQSDGTTVLQFLDFMMAYHEMSNQILKWGLRQMLLTSLYSMHIKVTSDLKKGKGRSPDSKVHGASMGPTWAPCWSHETCYLGLYSMIDTLRPLSHDD